MSQPGLIDSILSNVNMLFQDKVKSHNTPVTDPLRHKHENREARQGHWDYRSIIGKLSYLC